MAETEKTVQHQYSDMRIMTLKRFNLPLHINEIWNELSQKDTYVSFSNYHFISIARGPQNVRYPIIEAYRMSREKVHAIESPNKQGKVRKATAQNEGERRNVHVLQTMILFGDRPDYWKKHTDLLFITMVHLSNEINVTPEKFQEQVDAACSKKTKYGTAIAPSDWCIYYTLDFSDAILFVRNCSFDRYQKLLWELTVSVKADERVIIDTISLYGVNARKAIAEFRKIEEDGTGNYPPYPLKNRRNCFDLALYLGVQNAEAWKSIKQKLEDKYGKGIERPVFYRKFGRTDITVTFRDFDLKNALYLAWLLFFDAPEKTDNQFGSCVISPRGKPEESTLTAIKQVSQGENKDVETDRDSNKQGRELYDIVKYTLMPLYNYANPLLRKLYPPLSSYCTELYQSLLTLLNSSFAEEYYLSVLPSFAAHLKLFGDSIMLQQETANIGVSNSDILVDEMREYYRGLIMLEHSTLHGEKEFIQAPALNAFICEVPAKLLTLYTALAFRIITRLHDYSTLHKGRLYIPLFIPDFRQDMYSRHICERRESTTQIGIIYLEEQLFYEPEYAIPSMVHELAHRVGDKSRKRDLRLVIIFQCLSVYLISSVLPEEILKPAAKCIDWLARKMAQQFAENCMNNLSSTDGVPYLEDIRSFLKHTGAGQYLLNKNINRAFVEELVEQWKKIDSENEMDVLFPLLEKEDERRNTLYFGVDRDNPRRPMIETLFFYALLDDIAELKNDQDTNEALYLYCESLLAAFSEAYSDMRMLETIAELDYHHILATMFKRKDFGKETGYSDCIQRYDLREVPVSRVFGIPYTPQKRKPLDARTEFVLQKTQDEMVTYLRECKQTQESDQRISAFVRNGASDIMMIRDEIAYYRKELLQFFEEYAKQHFSGTENR